MYVLAHYFLRELSLFFNTAVDVEEKKQQTNLQQAGPNSTGRLLSMSKKDGKAESYASLTMAACCHHTACYVVYYLLSQLFDLLKIHWLSASRCRHWRGSDWFTDTNQVNQQSAVVDSWRLCFKRHMKNNAAGLKSTIRRKMHIQTTNTLL